MRTNSLLFCFTTLVLLHLSTSFFGFDKAPKSTGLDDDIPFVELKNGVKIPLVGQGVGNLPSQDVESMVYQGIKNGHKVRLVDTSHHSGNEKLVAKGIVAGVRKFKETTKTEGPIQVHVVTKVWYTHLGYGRTKLSVQESLDALSLASEDPDVDLKVHFLLHWPRCYDSIDWMDCEQEEEDLPERVKLAGPPPHEKPEAWRESWRALEDMYRSKDHPQMAGLGVSNFNSDQMGDLLGFARVKPHMTQMNVWSLLHDPHLVDHCIRNTIHMQVFNIMHGVLGNIKATPSAERNLKMITEEVQQVVGTDRTVTSSQVILKWLIQYGITVLPRTSSYDRLKENSAISLSALPDLTEEQEEIIAHVLEATLSGVDMQNDVFLKVTFYAENEDMALFYNPGPTKDDMVMVKYIPKGASYDELTFPGHKFRVYSATNTNVYQEHVALGNYGEHKHIRVTL